MKRKLLYKRTLVLLLLGISVSLSAQIRKTVRFDDFYLRREIKTEERGIFTTLEYPDCYIGEEEGAPSLPYKYLQFIVPGGVDSYTVQVVSTTDKEFGLPYRVRPIQTPVTPSIYKTVNPYVMPDPSIYYSDLAYPLQAAEVVSDGYFDGDKRIITVKVSPMQYYPTRGDKIVFHESLNLLIVPADASQAETVNSLAAIHSSVLKSDEKLMKELDFVENKGNILAWAKPTTNISSSAISLSLPAYEYTIIAPAAYVSTLEKLVFWKKMKGMTAGVVTVESILNHPDIKGDEVSKIYDDAGKIRHYLTYAYQQGAKYVFLVGKEIPFRYGYCLGKIPTDLYYSDLNGNWNTDGDKEYGEDTDKLDFLPELYVGRITCKNKEELNNYLYKLFSYEKNPGNGDNSYLAKSFYTQADELQAQQLANKFAGEMMFNFTNSQIFQEEPSYDAPDPTFPKGKDVIDEINKHYGFVGFFNHGYDFGMSITREKIAETTLTGLWMMDSYDDAFAWPEAGNGADCLTNIRYPFVVYSVSCSTMPYDKISNIPYNLGEAFTVMGKYGAVAYLGNTRDSHRNDMNIEFAKYLKESENRIGVAEAKSKMNLKIKSQEKIMHNLLGCPELQLWQGKPMNYSNIEITYEDDYLDVSTGVKYSYVNMIGLFEAESRVEQRYLDIVLGGYFHNPPKNYIITINKQDYLPYIAPLYLQNESITGKYNLFHLKNVFLGNHVDAKKASGNFIIKNGADLSMEYSGEVVLDSGFEIEKGAAFELKPVQE